MMFRPFSCCSEFWKTSCGKLYNCITLFYYKKSELLPEFSRQTTLSNVLPLMVLAWILESLMMDVQIWIWKSLGANNLLLHLLLSERAFNLSSKNGNHYISIIWYCNFSMKYCQLIKYTLDIFVDVHHWYTITS